MTSTKTEDDSSYSLNLLTGASDLDGDTLSVSGLALQSGNTAGVTVSGNSLSINPAAYNYLALGQQAVIVYTYNVVDGNGGSVAQSATITINGVNDAAVAVNDNATTAEDTPVTINVLANDSDPDTSDTLSIDSFTNGTHGTVSQSGNNLVYTPALNYNGSDSFTYTLVDGGTATVNITVNAANDAPTVTGPVTSTKTEDDSSYSLNLLTGASDLDGDTLSVSGLALQSGNTAGVTVSGNSLSINPAAYNYLALGQQAVIVYTYNVVDGNGGSVAQSATITINGVNDAAVAVNDNATTAEDTPVTINVLANDSDPDTSDTLSIDSFTNGTHGTVSQSGNNLVYTPALNYNGSDSFTYTLVDGGTATVNITVNAANDAPTVTGPVTSTKTEDDSSYSLNLLTGASDLDGDTLSVSGLALQSGNTAGVTVSGNSLSINPAAYNYLALGQQAVIVYTYNVVDGNGGSVAQSATITINGVNDAAVAVNDNATTAEDTPVTINVLANDSDPDTSDTLSIDSFTNGTHGTVSQSGNNLVYTPALNYNGSDSFTYTLVDGGTATVNITVNAANDAPTVTGPVTSTKTEDDSSYSLNLLTGASDIDGDTLSVSGLALQSGNTAGVTVSGNSLSINPAAYNYLALGQQAVIVYTYNVVDGNGGSVAQSATITINGVNDAAVAVNDNATTAEDTPVTINVLANDSDRIPAIRCRSTASPTVPMERSASRAITWCTRQP